MIFDYEIPAAELKGIIEEYKVLIQKEKGFDFLRMFAINLSWPFRLFSVHGTTSAPLSIGG
jgi:hypothetical protein